MCDRPRGGVPRVSFTWWQVVLHFWKKDHGLGAKGYERIFGAEKHTSGEVRSGEVRCTISPCHPLCTVAVQTLSSWEMTFKFQNGSFCKVPDSLPSPSNLSTVWLSRHQSDAMAPFILLKILLSWKMLRIYIKSGDFNYLITPTHLQQQNLNSRRISLCHSYFSFFVIF